MLSDASCRLANGFIYVVFIILMSFTSIINTNIRLMWESCKIYYVEGQLQGVKTGG